MLFASKQDNDFSKENKLIIKRGVLYRQISKFKGLKIKK